MTMNRSFNNGIGIGVVIAADQTAACAGTLRAQGKAAFEIGAIAPRGEGRPWPDVLI